MVTFLLRPMLLAKCVDSTVRFLPIPGTSSSMSTGGSPNRWKLPASSKLDAPSTIHQLYGADGVGCRAQTAYKVEGDQF